MVLGSQYLSLHPSSEADVLASFNYHSTGPKSAGGEKSIYMYPCMIWLKETGKTVPTGSWTWKAACVQGDASPTEAAHHTLEGISKPELRTSTKHLAKKMLIASCNKWPVLCHNLPLEAGVIFIVSGCVCGCFAH